MRLGGWVFIYNARVYQSSNINNLFVIKNLFYLMSFKLNQNKSKIPIENERMYLNVGLFTRKRLDEEIVKLRSELRRKERNFTSYDKGFNVEAISSGHKLFNNKRLIKTQILQNEILREQMEKFNDKESTKTNLLIKAINTKTKGNTKQLSYNKKETDDVYKKIFDKNTRKLIEIDKSKDNQTIIPKNYMAKINPEIVKNKIKDIKSKIVFMKGVYDYAYPLIMIKKLKTQKKENDELIKSYHKKIIKRHQTLLRPTEEKILLTDDFIDSRGIYIENTDKPTKTPRIDPLMYIRTTRNSRKFIRSNN